MTKKITFTLAPEIVADATEGILLGDFNNWLHEAGIKLKKQKDGSLKASADLEPGIYQYRYFLNDGRWVNDGNAHGYSFNNEYGVDNCIITVQAEVKETLAKDVVAAEPAPKAKKAAAKVALVAEPKVAPKAKATVKAAAAKVEKTAAPKKTVQKATPATPAKPAAKTAVKAPAATKSAKAAPVKAEKAKAEVPAKKGTKKAK